MAPSSSRLRERTRRAVRAELTAVAVELFSEQGYEETTVEQIAAAAGISRSSFFRYFSTKEEVLLEAVNDTGDQVASALAARPADERPWTALRRAFDDLLASMERHAEQSKKLARLMLQSPALHAAHLRKRTTWTEVIAAALEPRLDDPESRRRRLGAVALAGAALTCLEAAQQAWIAEGSRASVATLVDDAMSAVADI
jgi:AcrR family transcriptional regulator